VHLLISLLHLPHGRTHAADGLFQPNVHPPPTTNPAFQPCQLGLMLWLTIQAFFELILIPDWLRKLKFLYTVKVSSSGVEYVLLICECSLSKS